MKIEGFDIQEQEVSFGKLHMVIEENGFVHSEQWDYERVTFDYRFLDKAEDATYYLRIPAYSVSGEIGKEDTRVKLMTPYLGRHYYPHGVEYDEEFPEKIVNKCKQKLAAIEKELKED
ncbi:YugN family protein [Thalassorhabdus alkalitolerans]|uniref:YugN family protein n=1 Tax=Thalassorhabdus alkalitolerans TaxID=2282697 RepID=A0ABW0YIP9_9BACI|nr:MULTISPECIES: YugN family protein [Bacillaceae]